MSRDSRAQGARTSRYTGILPRVLYFAYGSNLDSENWEAWCNAKGYDSASIEPLGRAWLPEHELVFHYRSRLRKSGTLDVRPRHGTSIPGALFRVHDWAGLDAKEGVSGGYYRRLSVTALTDDGRAHPATTYTVCDARVEGFVAPEAEYREIVTRGLSRFGHGCDGFLAAAAGVSPPAEPNKIFAYGTLMRGERGHGLLKPRVRLAHGPAQVVGASLVRIDWYPGLVLSDGGVVHGELYEVDEVDSVLHELDAYEDFAGYGRTDSLYRRSLVSVRIGGRSVVAWTYIFLGDPAAFSLISSGSWTDP
jgi:gamma-glutamylcyclotransferase (GGCT)/AIG2-like uncharacterized protein YtfP